MQKTAYEMRISDWSSDVCSSDLSVLERVSRCRHAPDVNRGATGYATLQCAACASAGECCADTSERDNRVSPPYRPRRGGGHCGRRRSAVHGSRIRRRAAADPVRVFGRSGMDNLQRSEEHTSELQSLMRISYAVFCL